MTEPENYWDYILYIFYFCYLCSRAALRHPGALGLTVLFVVNFINLYLLVEFLRRIQVQEDILPSGCEMESLYAHIKNRL